MSGSLTHSPAEIIRQLLVDLALGTDDGTWPVKFATEPNSPDNVITVYNTAGRSDGRVQNGGERQEHHGFQVRIRSTSEAVGYTRARLIAVALDESVLLTTVTVSSSTYLIQSISRTGDILSLGKNHPETNLNLFTINALASLRQTS